MHHSQNVSAGREKGGGEGRGGKARATPPKRKRRKRKRGRRGGGRGGEGVSSTLKGTGSFTGSRSFTISTLYDLWQKLWKNRRRRLIGQNLKRRLLLPRLLATPLLLPATTAAAKANANAIASPRVCLLESPSQSSSSSFSTVLDDVVSGAAALTPLAGGCAEAGQAGLSHVMAGFTCD